MGPPLSTSEARPAGWVVAFTAISWLGEYAHNRFELPGLTLFSPENSLTALVALALLLLWWSLPGKRIPEVLLLVWGLLHLTGGGVLSVIPFKFLPFYPEQSVAHYLAHALYGLAQLPLVILLLRELRRTRAHTRIARRPA